MPIQLRNKLFFFVVLFLIFPNIPRLLQLNFIGAFLGKDLSFYPILVHHGELRLLNIFQCCINPLAW